jgi:fructokinase
MTDGRPDWCIGIDVGGTKISAALMHRDGTVAKHLRTPTPRDDYHATIAAIGELVQQLQVDQASAPTVGIGIPGSCHPQTGQVRNANSTWLNDRDFKADLAAHIGQPIRMANDANCFALSEAKDGAASGHRVVWGIILGTGVGSGLVIDGQLLDGPLSIAGEWGHNPMPASNEDQMANRPPPTCWCGRPNCIESWLSGPAIAADHLAITGKNESPEEIFAAAASGAAPAVQTVERHLERLARAMAVVINIIDPDIIVMGGGIGARADICAALRDKIAPHLFTGDHERASAPAVTIRPARWGADSGVRGAARLWDAETTV